MYGWSTASSWEPWGEFMILWLSCTFTNEKGCQLWVLEVLHMPVIKAFIAGWWRDSGGTIGRFLGEFQAVKTTNTFKKITTALLVKTSRILICDVGIKSEERWIFRKVNSFWVCVIDKLRVGWRWRTWDLNLGLFAWLVADCCPEERESWGCWWWKMILVMFLVLINGC